MRDKDKIVLNKIIERINSVLLYCKECNYETFEANTMLVEACVFNILQIGELSKQSLSDEFKEEYCDIPWKQLNGMRNRIVHGYEGIKLNIVWDTINENFPELKEQLIIIQQKL
ncbi:MAG: DUF86 domain-containing protein [Anaerotignaceae bacterium]